MRLGQIRRLDYWLEKCFFDGFKDTPEIDARKEARKKWKPIIEQLLLNTTSLPDDSFLKTPAIQGRTLEQIEVECFGYECSFLLLRGYAPGSYMGTCYVCKETFGGDKRCIICVDCAAKQTLNLS